MNPTTYRVERSNEEIDELLNRCADAESDGKSQYPGMTYEQGMLAGIEWLLGVTDEPPFEDM